MRLVLIVLLLLAVVCVGSLLGCASTTTYVHGIPNLSQVGPGIWRSGQPTSADQWLYLKSLGITKVIKLNMDGEGSDDGARAAGLTVYELGIEPEGDKDVFDNILNTFVKPDPNKVDEAEAIIEVGGGILVHCTHGQDRTGIAIGLHRVLHDHWTKDAAYQEMIKHGFHPELHGLHEFWENFNGTEVK